MLRRAISAALMCAGSALAAPASPLPVVPQVLQVPQVPHVLAPDAEMAVLPTSSITWDAQHQYALPELIDLALRNHPETRIAWASVRNAALAVDNVDSTYQPRVWASVAGGHLSSTDQQQIAPLAATKSNSSAGAVSAVSLLWLLYDFGQRGAAADAARALEVAARANMTGTYQRVVYQICVAYYAYQAARQRKATSALTLANALEIQTAAEARRRGGVGTVLEVAEVRQGSAQARLADIQARGAEQDALTALLAAMGLPPLAAPRIAPVVQRPLDTVALASVDTMVREALGRRADVQAAHAALRASLAAELAARADYRPKLFLSATGAYAAGESGVTAIPGIGPQLPTLNIQGRGWNSTVMLGISVPIYDGHMRDNAVQQAVQNADKARAALDKLRIEAVSQIVQARNHLDTSLAAREAAQNLQETSQLRYDAALDAYRHGVGTLTAVVAARTQLAQARLARDDAWFGALSATVTLSFATGALGEAPR